jgi:hypothetical protein
MKYLHIKIIANSFVSDLNKRIMYLNLHHFHHHFIHALKKRMN